MASNSLVVVFVMTLLVFVSVGADEAPPAENLKDVAVDAVTSSLTEAHNFSDYIVKLKEDQQTKSTTVCNALSECVKLMEDAETQINTAILKLKELSHSQMKKNISDIQILLFEANRSPERCVDELVTAVLSDPEIWSKPDPSQIFTMMKDRSQSFVQSLNNAIAVVARIFLGENP